MPKKDLAAGLNALPAGKPGGMSKVDVMFGDQPDVLEAIRVARQDRHLGFSSIAAYLTREGGEQIGDTAIKRWLNGQGIA
jgi:hypothetical protein